MINKLTDEHKKYFIEIEDKIVNALRNELNFDDLFLYKPRDDGENLKKGRNGKQWLKLFIKEKNDYTDALIFKYSKSEESSKYLTWDFVPNFGIKGKDDSSKRKSNFFKFAENSRFVDKLNEKFKDRKELKDVSVVLNRPHERKGLRILIPTDLNSWKESAVQEGYVQKSITFVNSVLPLINEWYAHEQEEKLNKAHFFNMRSNIVLQGDGIPEVLITEKEYLYKYTQEDIGDADYQNKIAQSVPLKRDRVIEDVPVLKPLKSDKASSEVYRRNAQRGKNAILDANYLCEVSTNHKDFTSKITGKNYVEAHHLIPMEYQDGFDVSVDVEANIVSLCVSCHKSLHHAIFEEKKAILNALHDKRVARLEKCGIKITKEILFSYYE